MKDPVNWIHQLISIKTQSSHPYSEKTHKKGISHDKYENIIQ